MSAPPPALPLVARAAADVLFRAAGRGFTAAGFLRDVERVAAALPEARHVFNLCQDRYWFAVGFAAALCRGQVSLLTSDRSPERLRLLAGRLGGACSIGEGDAPESPFPHHRIGAGGPDAGRGEAAVPAIPADRLAAIVFTSGSTGEPVGARKDWGTLAGRSIAAGARFGMGAERPVSVLGTVPPWHMYGFETTLLLPLHAACASWCAPLFYPSDVREALAAVPAPRVLVTTPLQLRALLQAAPELPALAAIISATAPLDPALAAEAERLWGTETLEIFGATEVGSIASRRTVRGPEWTLYDGVRLEAGEGPVRVLAPPAEPGVLNDFVELTGPDRFRLIGRAGDLVKLGGRRASLAGLNRMLNAIPGVADGVFLPPDDDDQLPAARMQAFVIAPDRSAEDILAELRERIDPIFLPRRVVRVDRLPRNELGKLPREALRKLETQRGQG